MSAQHPTGAILSTTKKSEAVTCKPSQESQSQAVSVTAKFCVT